MGTSMWYLHVPGFAGPVKSTRPCLYNWETQTLHIVDFKLNFLHHDIEFNAVTQTVLAHPLGACGTWGHQARGVL